MRLRAVQLACLVLLLSSLSAAKGATLRSGEFGLGGHYISTLLAQDHATTADEATLDRLEGEGRVAFRYAEPVNGSARDIAGLLNEGGNVLGMMPHPERMIEPAQGGSDGRALFAAVARGLVGA